MKRTRFALGTILAVMFTLIVGPSTVQLFAQGGTWATKAPMPTARFGLGAASVHGVVYAIGGDVSYFGCAATGANEAYDPVANTWTTMAPMPTPRWSLGVAVLNGIIYVVGGSEGCYPPSTVVEAYDPSTNLWSEKAPFPTSPNGYGVTGAAIGVINGIMYVAGGTDTVGASPYFSTLYAYDPVANTWSTKAAMPDARTSGAGAVVNGSLYVVGGSNLSGFATSTFAYDPTSNMWSTKAPLSDPRTGLAAATVNNDIYAMGGYDATSFFLNTMEAYDPAIDTWTTLASMPTPRNFLAADQVNGTIYAIGGLVSGYTNTAAVEAFTPAPQNQPPVARVGGDQTVECAGPSGTSVTLNGSASSDPDGDTLTYKWTDANNNVLGTSATITVTAPMGTTAYTLTVTDPGGVSSSATTHITVRDTTPPVLALPISITVDASSPAGAAVAYTVTATDICDPNPSVTCTPTSGSTFPAGTTTVNCTAKDAFGNAATGSFSVIVNGAAAQVSNLVLVVNGLDFAQGLQTSLDAKLQAAQAALAAARANDTVTACNQINAFINYVMAQSGKQITVAQANQLIAAGLQIKATLGCP